MHFESNQCGIETAIILPPRSASRALNRTNVELKLIRAPAMRGAQRRFESNQCGIETFHDSSTSAVADDFESNQCGIETAILTRSLRRLANFESNQCGIETQCMFKTSDLLH